MTWAELNEVRDLNKTVNIIKRELRALELSRDLKVPVFDGMPKTTAITSSVERVAIRIVDVETRLKRLEVRMEGIKPLLESKLRAEIDDAICRMIYIFRYVDCMYFRDIGILMGYSEAHIYYLHRITGEKIISDWKK